MLLIAGRSGARGRSLLPSLLLAAALAAPVLLAGCGSDPPRPGPAVSGKFGSDPVITIPAGNPPGQLMVQTLIPGNGPVVRPDDYVLFNVEGKTWAGGRQIANSFTDRTPQGLPLTNAMPAWRKLAGQRVGSRVMMVVPPKDGFGPDGDPSALVSGTDTLVFVFDVLAAMPPDASPPGTAGSYSAGPALPSVRWNGRVPVITVPAGASPPKSLVSRVITRGGGPPVTSGETVTVQDTGVVWRTGKVFDSTWQRGFPQSFLLGSGQVIPGWEAGLGGLPVGSRVLLVIPPTMGYGASGDPPYVKTTDTTVFVIDIVSALR
ncbi:MAG TPA: FKBP-type peptidyl-prolyl cis-trans isomerase [Streptosporangiaceae bacterium]|jgi:peptidylprolyl isomerase|nr:FKBP-type peptidyl-prolyl cis-trans isomerase [Streptosporangiaceae bacterium]